MEIGEGRSDLAEGQYSAKGTSAPEGGRLGGVKLRNGGSGGTADGFVFKTCVWTAVYRVLRAAPSRHVRLARRQGKVGGC